MLSTNIFAQSNCNCKEYDVVKGSSDSLNAIKLLSVTSLPCKAKGLEMMGNFMAEQTELDSAEYYLSKAEQTFQALKCSDSLLMSLYETWATVYYKRANFSAAQTYTLKMLHCAEVAGNMYKMATCNTMIAQLFNQTNQAEKGIDFTRKAVVLLPKMKNNAERMHLLFLLAKRYLWHYQDTKQITSLDSSKLFTFSLLSLAKKENKFYYITKAFNNLQGIAFELEDYKQALQLTDSSLAYTTSTQHIDLRTIYFDKADILIELLQYDEALKFADSSLHYGNKFANYAYVAENYALLARIYELKGNYKSAYNYYKLEKNITDSIRNIGQIKAVSELEKKYSQVKNEATIGELSKKKQLYLMLALVAFFAVIAIAFYLRQQTLKHKKNILETEQRLNRARMNPHFFFNALATLQQVALNENDGQKMASNLSKFSNIMRETLESTYKEYITIEQEIDFLNEYLEVQKIRFPQKFQYSIFADDSIEINELLIPSMIIQPFVENSIEHGFVGIDYVGELSVHFIQTKDEICIEIKDNGVGLQNVLKENNQHISRASQIIKDRIYLLNIKLKTKAGFSIDNVTEKNGVIVKIHLPLIYKTDTNN